MSTTTETATPTETGILLARDDRNAEVVTVTLNKPNRKNAMSWAMWQELRAVLDEIALDPTIRIVILSGAGGSFCSGADLAAPAPRMHPLGQMEVINSVVLALHRLPKVTIARVDGDAVGAGMNLALACDLTVATERSRFSEIFVRRGLSIDCGGSWILPRLIGLHRAKELCLTGDIVSATEARQLGLLNRVVPDGALDEAMDLLVERLLLGAPIAQLVTKRLLTAGGSSSLDESLDRESMAQIDNLGSSDSTEARAAFVEKRAPRFTGAWPGRS
ncbi:enoyl-CoA hydratase/isomerase family protein [Rhodococcus sp. JS3073]|uniref:enoyl-CoA hydratase/isomerase family protein n=1 Tax=Rhodococcus sp. JS3073 TaxID=3002901 RepID=UPI002286C951|nr:enoyl-CoA hydratase-related protein [Rhodococcus sp. JS3073]WAM19628.1 enoyl-CoA hydratase-related protein [Rhodococcus sp. JS3073]